MILDYYSARIRFVGIIGLRCALRDFLFLSRMIIHGLIANGQVQSQSQCHPNYARNVKS
jgi:hypothetical protein